MAGISISKKAEMLAPLPNFAEKASPVSFSVRGGDESVILKKHYLSEHIFGIILIGSFEGRDL